MNSAPRLKTTRTCIAVANGARARILIFGVHRPDSEMEALREILDLINPSQRLRRSEIYSETRPGLQQAAPAGARHGVDDHRERHRAQEIRRFATEIAAALGGVCEALSSCRLLVFAAPQLLAELRAALSKHPEQTKNVVDRVECNRDVTQLTLPELHDWLAASKFLPPRQRRNRA